MLYEYHCEKCDLIHQVEQSMVETTPIWGPCPKCGHPAMKKYITNVNFSLHGHGWNSKKPRKIDPKADWVKQHQKNKWE